MTKRQSAQFEKTFVETTKVDYAPFGNGIFAYTVARSYSNKPAPPQGMTDDRGLITEAELRNLLDGKPYTPLKFNGFKPVFITAEGREYIRKNGLPNKISQERDALMNSKHWLPEHFWGHLELAEMDGSADCLFFASHIGDTVMDIRGKELPRAVVFNGMYGMMTNQYFDIAGIKEALEARDDISFTTEGDEVVYRSKDVWGNDIKALSFKWSPSVEDWNKAVEAACNANNGTPQRVTTRHILIDADIFGFVERGLANDELTHPSTKPINGSRQFTAIP